MPVVVLPATPATDIKLLIMKCMLPFTNNLAELFNTSEFTPQGERETWFFALTVSHPAARLPTLPGFHKYENSSKGIN